MDGFILRIRQPLIDIVLLPIRSILPNYATAIFKQLLNIIYEFVFHKVNFNSQIYGIFLCNARFHPEVTKRPSNFWVRHSSH